MNDQPDVGFIDAHAEGDRGHHYLSVIPYKICLITSPILGAHACMVGKRRDTGFLEMVRQLVYSLSALTIDNN